MSRRLSHSLLSFWLALVPGPSGSAGWIVAEIAAISAVALLPAPAEAQTARRSGGYGLPGSGGGGSYSAPSRRPSPSGSGYSGSYGGGSRAPSYSGGYSGGGHSGGDRAISRQGSGAALQQYRAGQQAAPNQAPQPDRRPSTGYSDPWGGGGERRPSTTDNRNTWGNGPASPAPGYRGGFGGGFGGGYNQNYPSYVPTQRFGVWDGLLLWSLLNTLNQPGRSQFFYSNQDDPGYRQWRAQMDAAAAQDPSLRQTLGELDRQISQLQGQPKTPGKLPPDVAGGTPTHAIPDDDGSMVLVVLFLAVGAFVLLWYWRRRGTPQAALRAPAAPAALGGSAQTRFRVGMTFPVDPTPFVLAAVNTKVTGIDADTVSVEAIGVLMDGQVPLHRLYLPGRHGFFQLHLGRDGQPDECRYFSLLDEVSPASPEEWGVWLDPAQGLIGWPQFETKDGKTYDRVWGPGTTHVPPRDLSETVQDLTGTSQRVMRAMLYAGATGASQPAPQTEYILVAAVEEAGQAWVEIHAGIDINPASLTLPAVNLT